MKTYKAYRFRDKDPVIDELRTVIQDTTGKRNFGYRELKSIELAGGPSVTCMDNWFHGETKRPQSASVEAAGRALGFKRVWIKIGEGDK